MAGRVAKWPWAGSVASACASRVGACSGARTKGVEQSPPRSGQAHASGRATAAALRWCGRYGVGPEWVSVRETDSLWRLVSQRLRAEATHSIENRSALIGKQEGGPGSPSSIYRLVFAARFALVRQADRASLFVDRPSEHAPTVRRRLIGLAQLRSATNVSSRPR